MLTCIIPFFVGGTWFAFVGSNYLDKLPPHIVSIYDRLLVFCIAYLDMGLAFAVASFTVLSIIRKLMAFIRRFRKPDVALKSEA